MGIQGALDPRLRGDDELGDANSRPAYTAVMRLTPAQRQAIRQRFQEELGPGTEIRLFGSRLDDTARGGDVDLLVRAPHAIERRVWLAARLAAAAERVLQGRKVDVLLIDPHTPLEPVHVAAMREGVSI